MIKHRSAFALFIILTLLFLIALWVPYKYLPVDGQDDKIHHSLVFFALTILMFYSFRIRLFWTAGIMLMLAATTELSQTFIANRSSSWPDFQANAIGVALSIVCIFVGQHLLTKLKKSQ